MLCLLLVSIARPQQGIEEIHDTGKGIAIAMVVDRSGSMGREMTFQGRGRASLYAVKALFMQFVLGNGKELPGRLHDLIGLVTFARYADTVCPLTGNHEVLQFFVDGIQVVTESSEDGTAMGDALALAAARLEGLQQSADRQRIKSKIIILLTDGQNNAGTRTPMEAAQLAKKWGVKIYAVGVGPARGHSVTVETPFGRSTVEQQEGVDEENLQAVARETGGSYWRVQDPAQLWNVYKTIDQLEKTRIDKSQYLDYAERFSPLALAALLVLTMEVWLQAVFFRKVP